MLNICILQVIWIIVQIHDAKAILHLGKKHMGPEM